MAHKTYVVKLGEYTFETDSWWEAWRQAMRHTAFAFDSAVIQTEAEAVQWNKAYNRLHCLPHGEGFLATFPNGKQISLIETA